MVVVFLGTPLFAVPSLTALAAAGYEIRAVYTQPDRPRGRGQQVAQSPVKEEALRLGLSVMQPERIRRPENFEALRGLAPEMMVVVGYGQILPQSIIDIAPRGIVNVHGSLLPKYRGAAPIQWAIANGERVTGVTTMQIDAGLDTGPMLLKAETAIGEMETAPELGSRLAAIGAELLIRTIIENPTQIPQTDSEATLARILKKEDGSVDWAAPARTIHNRRRGFTPWPGAYTTWRGAPLKIHATRVVDGNHDCAVGTLLARDRRLFACCGEGTMIEILELQQEGRKRVSAENFLNGQTLHANERLES